MEQKPLTRDAARGCAPRTVCRVRGARATAVRGSVRLFVLFLSHVQTGDCFFWFLGTGDFLFVPVRCEDVFGSRSSALALVHTLHIR